MAFNTQSINTMRKLLAEKGEQSQQNARTRLLDKFNDNSQIAQALRYFSNSALNKGMAVFPSLLSISFEAAGGAASDETALGEAIVMLTGAADIHDDVIDKSIVKGSKKTVFGKYGKDVAILAGDVLLVEGMTRLFEASADLNQATREKILDLVNSAVFEISNSETLEFQFRQKGMEIGPKEFSEIIKRKSVVPELVMKIGAILAGGDSELVNLLGKFGKTFGFVTTVVDEFIDILDTEELIGRLKNECPPLPLVYILQNQETRRPVIEVLDKLPDNKAKQRLMEIVSGSSEIRKLAKNLVLQAKGEIKRLSKLVNGKSLEELETIILAPLAYLTDLFPLAPSGGTN